MFAMVVFVMMAPLYSTLLFLSFYFSGQTMEFRMEGMENEPQLNLELKFSMINLTFDSLWRDRELIDSLTFHSLLKKKQSSFQIDVSSLFSS